MRRILGTACVVVGLLTLSFGIAGAHHSEQCRPGQEIWHATAGNLSWDNNDAECVAQVFANANDLNTWYLKGGHDDAIMGGGNDFADGGNGDDILDLGYGSDIAYGGDGNDTIIEGPGPGNDQINGGNGHDIVYAGRGTDYARGGVGTNMIYHCHDGSPQDDLGGFGTHFDRFPPSC